MSTLWELHFLIGSLTWHIWLTCDDAPVISTCCFLVAFCAWHLLTTASNKVLHFEVFFNGVSVLQSFKDLVCSCANCHQSRSCRFLQVLSNWPENHQRFHQAIEYVTWNYIIQLIINLSLIILLEGSDNLSDIGMLVTVSWEKHKVGAWTCFVTDCLSDPERLM